MTPAMAPVMARAMYTYMIACSATSRTRVDTRQPGLVPTALPASCQAGVERSADVPARWRGGIVAVWMRRAIAPVGWFGQPSLRLLILRERAGRLKTSLAALGAARS